MGGFIRKHILKEEKPRRQLQKQAEEDERRRLRGRKGRRSTILTSSKGLNEISDEEYEQKTLLS